MRPRGLVGDLAHAGERPSRTLVLLLLPHFIVRLEVILPMVVLTTMMGPSMAEDRIVPMMSEMKLEPGEESEVKVIRIVVIPEVIVGVTGVAEEVIDEQIQVDH